MNNAKIVSRSGVATIYTNGKCLSFDPSHPEYKGLLDLLDKDKYDEIAKFLDVAKRVERKFKGTGVEVVDGCVLHNGVEVHNAVCTRIIDFTEAGRNPENLVNFLTLLKKNPSYNSQQQLYSFLEVCSCPIDNMGFFLAYKKVQKLPDGKLVDYWTRKIDNSPGQVVTLERSTVCDDPNIHCGQGAHIGSKYYATTQYHAGEGVVVAVRCSPEFVVSVPNDHGFQKLRACQYEVLSILDDQTVLTQDYVDSQYKDDFEEEDSDCEDDCECYEDSDLD